MSAWIAEHDVRDVDTSYPLTLGARRPGPTSPGCHLRWVSCVRPHGLAVEIGEASMVWTPHVYFQTTANVVLCDACRALDLPVAEDGVDLGYHKGTSIVPLPLCTVPPMPYVRIYADFIDVTHVPPERQGIAYVPASWLDYYEAVAEREAIMIVEAGMTEKAAIYAASADTPKPRSQQ